MNGLEWTSPATNLTIMHSLYMTLQSVCHFIIHITAGTWGLQKVVSIYNQFAKDITIHDGIIQLIQETSGSQLNLIDCYKGCSSIMQSTEGESREGREFIMRKGLHDQGCFYQIIT